METQDLHLSVTLTIIEKDELDALRDKAEILEDMHEQREAEADRWFWKWLDEYEAHFDTKAELGYVEGERDDYAARLRATNEAYRKLGASRDYADDRLKMVRERVKTYRATLASIVDGYDPFRYNPRSGDGLRRLAWHVLNSRIEDGGSDF